MAEHGSVEQELWNIFTFYTLHGNPMYPDLLKSSQFSKLCKQCLIMKTKDFPEGLSGAVINVVYIGESHTTTTQPRAPLRPPRRHTSVIGCRRHGLPVVRPALCVVSSSWRRASSSATKT